MLYILVHVFIHILQPLDSRVDYNVYKNIQTIHKYTNHTQIYNLYKKMSMKTCTLMYNLYKKHKRRQTIQKYKIYKKIQKI